MHRHFKIKMYLYTQYLITKMLNDSVCSIISHIMFQLFIPSPSVELHRTYHTGNLDFSLIFDKIIDGLTILLANYSL